ncbi:hypothetical protein CIHG_05238 [Coccidioides immitis H538.4]|uniref:Uncharacterized protein n=1 Tax=Coccidioides immitis H538.4 TaxID=396776 RepID=A0A0J8UIX9_COCIT|nr:hypothetical protein CIHG_05238 [Coccidioides immitis H538.4]
MYRINRARHGWQANQLAHPTTARPSGCWDVGSANAKESTERECVGSMTQGRYINGSPDNHSFRRNGHPRTGYGLRDTLYWEIDPARLESGIASQQAASSSPSLLSHSTFTYHSSENRKKPSLPFPQNHTFLLSRLCVDQKGNPRFRCQPTPFFRAYLRNRSLIGVLRLGPSLFSHQQSSSGRSLVAESHLMHCKERYQSRSGEFAQPSNPGWIQNPDKEDE